MPSPPFRFLRVYAFDPSLDWQIETALMNQMTLKVPWEELEAGPVGEYLEVVDVDPASCCCYKPVDLNDRSILASDGLGPAEGNPQFHQQMVYAVAMTTIKNFERALGRRALWSDELGKNKYAYVQRLRLYPHALRKANAYYSPAKKAVLFGYFPASLTNPGRNLPGGMVFSCLSHDIIAHEVTHALLDGLHRRFIEPSNPDTLALHEAFADIVALFQHFSYPEVLRHQIAQTRGDLASQNLLGQLAQQFGQAIGSYSALRDALGETDEAGQWHQAAPDPQQLAKTLEPHARGAILVAAVFDAFLTIYRSRVADLLRIATGGSGLLLQGAALHPDLVDRLAREAAMSARHVLTMCIRALDYTPPVGVTFGDYLRALVTADRDLVPDDDRRYRIATIEAFRRRGIYPSGVRSLSESTLCWNGPEGKEKAAFDEVLSDPRLAELQPDWSLRSGREQAYSDARGSASFVHNWLAEHGRFLDKALGIALQDDALRSIRRGKDGRPVFEIFSVRPARRLGPDGDSLTDLVFEITQKRGGYRDPELQKKVDAGRVAKPPEPDFWFRGGSTVLVNLETREVRYIVRKRIDSADRLEKQRRFLFESSAGSLDATYFADPRRRPGEPFAALHGSFGPAEDPE